MLWDTKIVESNISFKTEMGQYVITSKSDVYVCTYMYVCLLSISGRKYKKYSKMIAYEGAGEGLIFYYVYF